MCADAQFAFAMAKALRIHELIIQIRRAILTNAAELVNCSLSLLDHLDWLVSVMQALRSTSKHHFGLCP